MKRFFISVLAALMLAAAPVYATETKTSTATKTKTEQVYNTIDQAERADKTPAESKPYKGHTIHRGSRGGFYYWKIASRGKNQGKVIKHYMTKKEKQEYQGGKTK